MVTIGDKHTRFRYVDATFKENPGTMVKICTENMSRKVEATFKRK